MADLQAHRPQDAPSTGAGRHRAVRRSPARVPRHRSDWRGGGGPGGGHAGRTPGHEAARPVPARPGLQPGRGGRPLIRRRTPSGRRLGGQQASGLPVSSSVLRSLSTSPSRRRRPGASPGDQRRHARRARSTSWITVSRVTPASVSSISYVRRVKPFGGGLARPSAGARSAPGGAAGRPRRPRRRRPPPARPVACISASAQATVARRRGAGRSRLAPR